VKRDAHSNGRRAESIVTLTVVILLLLGGAALTFAVHGYWWTDANALQDDQERIIARDCAIITISRARQPRGCLKSGRRVPGIRK
jgi:hypothetical protein